MIDKIEKAIRNNNDLYEAIFKNHNIRHHQTDSIWYSLEKTPPLYSNLVTTSKTWRPDEIFNSIALKYEQEKWDKWSIKDSFAVLDLSGYGFTRLFDAQWIYLKPADFIRSGEGKKLNYEIVNTVAALSRWRLAWDADEDLGKEIFDARLLDNRRVWFVAGYNDKEIASGCFVNKSDDVLGISNFFAPDEGVNHWSDMIGFIFDSIERSDIVGYERKELVAELQSLGFEATGNLTVWLKKRDS